MRELSCPRDFFKRYRRKPFRASDAWHVIAFGVDQVLMRYDLAIDAMDGMFAAIRHLHKKTPRAAGAKVYFTDRQCRTRTAPPLPEVFGLRPCLEK